MKKGFYGVMLCLIVIALAGCSSPSSKEEETTTELLAAVSENEQPQGDKAGGDELEEESATEDTQTDSDVTETTTEEATTTEATTTETTTTTTTEETTVANTKAAALSAKDLSASISGKTYKLNDSIANVTGALGEGYEYSESISCEYEGLDKIFMYSGVEFYTYPDGDKDFLNEIILTSSQYKTSRGVGVSDSKDKVIEAYGNDYEDKDGILVYSCNAGSLWFYLSGDSVASISFSK